MRKAKAKKFKRIPYDSLSDDEKVRRNWTKAIGLYSRNEWSVVILRCATCLELAVNFAIRQELVEDRKLPLPFVDKLLKNSNGIHNKYQNIYLPIMEEYEEHGNLKTLWSESISKVNTERNAVAHRGEFRSKPIAMEIMKKTYTALVEILELHSSKAKLKELEI
ncbi:MAG: hypothetical protein OEY59_12150 [Deltaproteobacteria bacterium]|nr:hypothetical protein [Deltaproteobacteria bacterium]